MSDINCFLRIYRDLANLVYGYLDSTSIMEWLVKLSASFSFTSGANINSQLFNVLCADNDRLQNMVNLIAANNQNTKIYLNIVRILRSPLKNIVIMKIMIHTLRLGLSDFANGVFDDSYLNKEFISFIFEDESKGLYWQLLGAAYYSGSFILCDLVVKKLNLDNIYYGYIRDAKNSKDKIERFCRQKYFIKSINYNHISPNINMKQFFDLQTWLRKMFKLNPSELDEIYV